MSKESITPETSAAGPKLLPMLPKPALGQPCNGCGECCRREVCGLGVEVLGPDVQAPCPFLTERDGRTWCGVVEAASQLNVAFGAHYAWRLGIGRGCDSEDDS